MTGSFAFDEETKKPGPDGSSEPGARQNTMDIRKVRTTRRTISAPCPAGRVTALRCLGISRPQEPKSTRRRRTLMDIYDKDPEIPYVKFEAATRDLVCSLMERQDRMNEEIFTRINDLAYRLEDLEENKAVNEGAK